MIEGGWCGAPDGVLAGVGCEGRKDIDSVPEKRTTETASATGKTAVSGLG